MVTITEVDGELRCASPYSAKFVKRVRNFGRWNAGLGVWVFDPKHAARLRKACIAIYGTDGDNAPVMVTVRIDFSDSMTRSRATSESHLVAGNATLAHRGQRDWIVRLDDGVACVEGEFPARGGSARYPAVFDTQQNVDVWPVLEVDLPIVMAQSVVEHLGTAATILDDVEEPAEAVAGLERAIAYAVASGLPKERIVEVMTLQLGSLLTTTK